jgi:serine/threonine-protein kinase
MNAGAQEAVIAAGTVVAGKFLLQAPLRQGGMGTVWWAQHTSLHVPCALKFLHPSVAQSAEMRMRFEREAIAAAQLRSPNVVTIIDHGVWEGVPYIAMELLDGEDLAVRLRRVHCLSPGETASIVAQVARALARAHAAGFVHRDLKPANIFLVRDDDREIAKVLDFGVAKIDGAVGVDEVTKTGTVLGTPNYMSPEQVQGVKNLDHRSDLWSLAVVAYRCLTGLLPFDAEALGELFMRIIVHPLPVPSQVARVPRGFDAWWLRAASRDPALRFQSARELADALALALGLTGGDAADLARSGPGFASSPTSAVPPIPPYAVVPQPPASAPTPAGAALTPAVPFPSSGGQAAPKSPAGRAAGVVLAGIAALGVGSVIVVRTLAPSGTAAVPAASAPPASADAALGSPRASATALATPPPEPEASASAVASVVSLTAPAPKATVSSPAPLGDARAPDPTSKATARASMPRPTAAAQKKNPFTDRN